MKIRGGIRPLAPPALFCPHHSGLEQGKAGESEACGFPDCIKKDFQAALRSGQSEFFFQRREPFPFWNDS
jgi:hypothetical protein